MFDSILFIILILVAIVELVLWSTWNASYFRSGLQIYSKKYPYIGTAPTPINENIINEAFKKAITHPLEFKQIETGEYAFREKLKFTLITYTPIMHGTLYIDKSSRNIRVAGKVNWSALAFIFTLLFFAADISILPFLITFLGILYLIQKYKYDKVAQFVYEWNSRNWAKSE